LLLVVSRDRVQPFSGFDRSQEEGRASLGVGVLADEVSKLEKLGGGVASLSKAAELRHHLDKDQGLNVMRRRPDPVGADGPLLNEGVAAREMGAVAGRSAPRSAISSLTFPLFAPETGYGHNPEASRR